MGAQLLLKIRKKEREREGGGGGEREMERGILKCEPVVELSFDKHFSSTFSPSDQVFQRCCAEVTLNPQRETFEGIWGGGGSDLLKNAS